MMQYFRPAMFGAATILAFQLSAPAYACSDLPNICAAQAQTRDGRTPVAAAQRWRNLQEP